jgi:Protein of unknown function (DUF992)
MEHVFPLYPQWATLLGNAKGPLARCAEVIAEPSRHVTGVTGPRQIWRGRRCCAIEKRAPGQGAVLIIPLASHSSAGDLFMRRSFILAGITLTALAASFGAYAQQPMQRVQVGILECRGGSSVGFIVGSVTSLGCVLRAEGMPEDRYVATIRKVGIDLGITQESALAWGVFAPVARLGPGDLAGNYAGAQGSATLGVGVGGNVLVGGSANSIALQPLSVQGQVGVSVAAGLESLELRPGR